METRTSVRRAVRAAAMLAAAAFAPQASALYVGMYAIGDFVPSDAGGCGGADRGPWPGMAQAWWDHMGVHGHFQGPLASKFKYIDGNMNVRRFCDTSFDPDCRDYKSTTAHGVDWMDAAIVATHGSGGGGRWHGTMRQPNASIPDGCDIEGGSVDTEIRVGDEYLAFLHLSSCDSADDVNLSGIRHAMADSATSTSRRAHQWDGFHGVMWIYGWLTPDYENVAHDGHYVSVAASWVTNLYRPNTFSCEDYDPYNWFGTCVDQCPIAYSISSSEGGALTRLLNERYNFVYSDPPGNSHYAYMYYEGCTPSNKPAFNP